MESPDPPTRMDSGAASMRRALDELDGGSNYSASSGGEDEVASLVSRDDDSIVTALTHSTR